MFGGKTRPYPLFKNLESQEYTVSGFAAALLESPQMATSLPHATLDTFSFLLHWASTGCLCSDMNQPGQMLSSGGKMLAPRRLHPASCFFPPLWGTDHQDRQL